jgi:hypothetical protein
MRPRWLDTTTALVRDSDSVHRTCGNQWALSRRSGGDRRIRRTGTWEGVLCERWDSRRGSVRHTHSTEHGGKSQCEGDRSRL